MIHRQHRGDEATMNKPMRPDREPPDPAEVARIDATEELEEIEDDEDAGLDELDKTLADSFPASDPPQAP